MTRTRIRARRFAALPVRCGVAFQPVEQLMGDDAKTRLRLRAADNGRSMEEEARLVLRDAVGRRRFPGLSRAPFAPGS
ncbi:MAG: hypothetical protein OXI81_18260 [Paracoccaceae bacterium]|nr:hypothetical protein [Paracoccaceae bacterium]